MGFRGLSLCIQGTLYREWSPKYKARFIPVYTGNTSEKWEPVYEVTVYPCVYREHISIIILDWIGNGLSLCIQGTHEIYFKTDPRWAVYPCVYREHAVASHIPNDRNRFIPVYTGNTINWLCVFSQTCGLSLCIQGTRSDSVIKIGENRFIPVYTGNTLSVDLSASFKSVYPCVYREHFLINR